MAHTSHRKPFRPRPRREIVPGADGWSIVTTTGRRRIVGVRPAASLRVEEEEEEEDEEEEEEEEGSSVDYEEADRRLRHLQSHYLRHRGLWETSAARPALDDLLRRGRCRTYRIDTCVCLGLGSLVDADTGMYQHQPRTSISMLQLAALETMLDLVRGAGAEGCHGAAAIAVYAQDPAFHAVDARFLSTREITVLGVPDAVPLIGDTCMVYAPHCETSVVLSALEGRDPALVVANDLARVVEWVSHGAPASNADAC
ncbi:MAG: hypothetical protein M1826_000760 [Phylliscum demangeonii]|nr:MAG: hypothetical protein M1826_000760 [Phylliscum demangeonii]